MPPRKDNGNDQSDDTSQNATPNPDNGEGVRDEANQRKEGEDRPADQQPGEMRAADAKDIPGAEQPMVQPPAAQQMARGVPLSQRTDPHSPMPEGDTAAHNAGNASPALGHPYHQVITTQYATQRSMGVLPDGGQSMWPIAPEPQDAGLVSPTGIAMRPAHHEAALSHLTMRLGELRNFLAGFDHGRILADHHPELHGLVSRLKDSFGLPQDPHEVAGQKAGYHNEHPEQQMGPIVAGPGSGQVARAGARWGNGPAHVAQTSAGSPAQGSWGPGAVQPNNT